MIKVKDRKLLLLPGDGIGPEVVREVKKILVVELAFDSMQESNRHKSGVSLRFPRFHRIRWDKPSNETLHLREIKSEFIN